MKTLIKNAMAVTMTCATDINNTDIIIENDKIAFIGKTDEMHTFDRVIDGNNKVVMPSLCNMHTHIAMTAMRNFADDVALFDWLNNHIWPAEENLDSKTVYDSTMLGIAEMIKSGTTCFSDMYFFCDETAKAVVKSGVRANIARGITDIGEDRVKECRVKLDENIAYFKEYNNAGDGRVRIDIGPHAVYTCSEKGLRMMSDTAKEYGMNLHIHLSETKEENENCMQEYGVSPTELMERNGVFDVNTIAAHCVHLSDNDIDILKKHNVTAVHNPVSNLKLGSGIADIDKLINNGVNVALGTDGVASNNNHNLFEEIKLAALLPKGVSLDASKVSAYDALSLATVNAAKAMGREDLGVIKVGAKADLVLINLETAELVPVNNVVSDIVYASMGNNVYMTMCDGKILYEAGEYKTIDIEKVLFNAKQASCKLIG